MRFSYAFLHLLCFLFATFNIQNAAVYPQKPIGRFIKIYDTLTYIPENIAKEHDNLIRRKRSTNMHDAQPMKLKFIAFGKEFYLELDIDSSVFHENALIEVDGRKSPIKKHLAVKGQLKNYPNSQVFGSIVNGVFRGSIAPEGHESSEGSFHIEPSGYYFDSAQSFHSIIYHDNHIRWDPPHSTTSMNLKRLKREIHSGTFCGLNRPDVAEEMKRTIPLENINPRVSPKASPYKSWSDAIRTKRATDGGYTTRVCNLFLQSDTFLWDRISSLSHVKNNHELAQQEITSIFTQHVQGAQAIYQNTLLKDFKNNLEFHGVSFRVDRIRINTTEDCRDSSKNPFCSANIDVTNFLNLNSYINHNDFCLAYVFTYRDFSGGTLGLAWVAEPGGSGGICEKFRLMREANQDVKKCLNTGIVTLLNYGSHVALKVSQLTFAHEMGHNFGSKHDDDHKGETDCLPDENNPRGNYIMFASATSGDKENNNQFSRCSKDSIARLVDNILKRDPSCFKTSNGPFCGNKIQEDAEECDCGFEEKDCMDKCCYPKKHAKACKLKETVKLFGTNEKVLCSPSAGECCSEDCQFRNSTQICRAAGECYNSSHCNSTSAKCPPSEKFPDGTLCQSGTRICKMGECIGSICERIPGWQECSLKRSDKITDEMMCYVSCKQNSSDSPCISTHQLEKHQSLRDKYPKLANELLRNNQGIQLKPGAPCDNYRGYCDSFSRCRSVDADGPLARLRNLIFSTQMIEKIRTWITGHWWAVIPIILGLIIFMIAFVKICAVHTPSHNPNLAAQPPLSAPGPPRKAKKHSAPKSGQNRRPPPGQFDSRLEGGPSSSSFSQHNNPPNRRSQHFYSPQQQAIPSRKQPRPLSMSAQEMVPISTAPQIPPSSSSNSSYHGVPQGLPRMQPNLPPPNYPPPDYNDIEIRQPPLQHGKGRGKKGHLQALNQQASKYKH